MSNYVKDIYKPMGRNGIHQVIAYTTEKLLESKKMADISVREIVESCGVSRTSFYRCFPDKYDVVLWIYNEHMKTISVEHSDFYGRMLEIMKLMSVKRSFFKNAFSYEQQNSLVDDILSRSQNFITNKIKNDTNTECLSDEQIFSIKFYCAGNKFAWNEYLFSGKDIPPKAMADMILANMPSNLKKHFS